MNKRGKVILCIAKERVKFFEGDWIFNRIKEVPNSPFQVCKALSDGLGTSLQFAVNREKNL